MMQTLNGINNDTADTAPSRIRAFFGLEKGAKI